MSDNWVRIIVGDSRNLLELHEESIDLVVTSPPYWHIRDYGVDNQIGYNQSLHEYLKDLYSVWKETYRVLKPGCRLCINIGDQFLRSAVYGRYKIVPLHSEVIGQCERIGFDYMGSIIWQKKTTINTTGGATVMGSFPYPRNGIIEIDYEFILIFKKTGKQSIDREKKERSRLSKEEWKEYFSSHWTFSGERQSEHDAMFPVELPKRLIRMFSIIDDTILDPFAGSGSTIKAAIEQERSAVGYEINERFLPVMLDKIGARNQDKQSKFVHEIQRRTDAAVLENTDYIPSIPDIKPVTDPGLFSSSLEKLSRVLNIIDDSTIVLDTGKTVRLAGIKVTNQEKAESYLRKYVKGKQVLLKGENTSNIDRDVISAYIYLKNRIFVNKELVKRGLAEPVDNDPKISRTKSLSMRKKDRESK